MLVIAKEGRAFQQPDGVIQRLGAYLMRTPIPLAIRLLRSAWRDGKGEGSSSLAIAPIFPLTCNDRHARFGQRRQAQEGSVRPTGFGIASLNSRRIQP